MTDFCVARVNWTVGYLTIQALVFEKLCRLRFLVVVDTGNVKS
ncbi:hypothetical protein [Marinobacter nauticus]|nr:hypothetical protein [Marinobacter nauticus]